MLNCPKCGSPRVHRSRTRTVWERVRKNFTNRRIHRCHGCGWRGWGPVTTVTDRPADPLPARTAPNVEIDVTVSESPTRRAEETP